MARLRASLLCASILIAAFVKAQPCLVGYTFTQSPPPTGGTYACGETVTFCFTVTSWTSTNANWFHGIVASFGPGWDLSTLSPGTPPPSCAGTGSWGWYPSVQGTAATNNGPQGPGFFYNYTTPADGNPGNNFGDNCTGAVNWQFCWTISVLSGPACVNGLGLGVTFNTFGDSETGSWGSGSCGSDPVVPSTPAVIQACSADAGIDASITVCSFDPSFYLITLVGGTPDAGGTWTDPTGAPFSGQLNPITAASGDYTYTVSSVSPPCTASSVVSVVVNPGPVAGTDVNLTACASDPVLNLWGYLGWLNGEPPGSYWIGPAGPHSGYFDPAVDPPGAYTLTVPGLAPCVDASATVTMAVTPGPSAGQGGPVTICSNSPPIQLSIGLANPDPGGTWTNAAGNMVSGTYNPATDSPGAFTYTVAGVSPCPNSTATVTVTENAAPDAGTNAVATLCSTAGIVSLTSLLSGTPQSGGVWTDASGAGVGDAFDAGSGTSGTYTYTVSGAAPCPNAQATLNLTIAQQPDAGTSSQVELCEASPPLDLFASLGGTPNPGGTWVNQFGQSVGAIYDPSTMSAGDFTYTIAALAPCSYSSATVSVNVNPEPSAGTSAALALCSDAGPTALLAALGANAQPGGSWTDPAGAPFSGSFMPGASADGPYTYNVGGVGPCPDASATVTVTTTSANNAGTGNPLAVCSSDAAVSLIASLSGNPQPGGVWTTPTGAPMSGTLNPATAANGNYTYTIVANGPCPSVSATVAVSIAQAPNAGSNGSHTLCSSNQASYNLINALGGAPSPTGSWTGPTGAPHGPAFTAGADTPGAYTYTVAGTAPCPSASSTVSMQVIQAPTAGTGGNAALCANDTPVDPTIWLTGTPDAGGTWSAPNGSTITQIDPASAASGAYTYTVAGTAPCPNAAATVQLTIDVLPNAGSDGSLSLCADAAPVAMLGYLSGAQPGGAWSGPTGASNGTFNPSANAPGAYIYAVNGTGACTGESDAAQLTVLVNPLPQPAFQVDVAAGCAPLQVQFVNEDPAGALSADWSFGDGGHGTGTTGTWHTYTTAGSFDVQLTVTDANGCTGTVFITDLVEVSTGPEAAFFALPARVSVNSPSTVVTHLPDAGISYSWVIDGIALDTAGIFRWTFDPPTVGEREICITATDALGCSNTHCQRVLIDDDLTIYVANAFTPNDDDRNEVFLPSVIGVEPSYYEFMVFDRWGLLVFSTNDPAEGWNGAMGNSGNILPQDVYVWKLKAKDQFTPEKAELIGTVTLLR